MHKHRLNKGQFFKNISDIDFTPAYFKVQKTILDEIEDGQLEPGGTIPPERVIAEEHKVSTGTVKKAISNLVNQGYIYRVQGKGTFVAGTELRRENLKYYRCLRNFGSDEAKIRMSFLGLEKIEGLNPVNQYLKIRMDEPLYELKRIFISGERPIIHTISYFPQKMLPNFNEFPRFKFERVPLFISIERNYGLPTIFNRELFGATLAQDNVAKILGVNQGTPVLFIEMLAFTYKERPYEYRQSYCVTDSNRVFREW